MTDILVKPTGRRGFLGGAMAGGGLLLLPASPDEAPSIVVDNG